ncbi:hypothetical protein AXG93_1552s1000 [Marchantia polymorpha subsp. ruderalis]|uniref:Uncharacterized protein n=1 Tax=Marchantia polymorpha subsp. ruderalis TaxID=1480154 RepID=A0A176WNE7_MARPO|nr:hypothetical protein AXG93_1552s1000 [Marchantia polymorpha subsp. ruderalis]
MVADNEIIRRITHRRGPVAAAAGLVKKDVGIVLPDLGDQRQSGIGGGHARFAVDMIVHGLSSRNAIAAQAMSWMKSITIARKTPETKDDEGASLGDDPGGQQKHCRQVDQGPGNRILRPLAQKRQRERQDYPDDGQRSIAEEHFDERLVFIRHHGISRLSDTDGVSNIPFPMISRPVDRRESRAGASRPLPGHRLSQKKPSFFGL